MGVQGRPEEHVAHRVREERSRTALSQRGLADAMNALGHETWRQTTVARTEAATRPLRVDELVSLAAVFALDVTDLLGEASSPAAAQIVELRAEVQSLRRDLAQARETLIGISGQIVQSTLFANEEVTPDQMQFASKMQGIFHETDDARRAAWREQQEAQNDDKR